MEWEYRYILESNKREIKNRINDLTAKAMGFDLPLQPYICNRDGEFSEKKVSWFIKELISGGMWEADGEIVELELDEEEKRFYSDFFYCAIRCFANDVVSRYGIYEEFRPTVSFQQLVEKARLADYDIRFRNYENLLRSVKQSFPFRKRRQMPIRGANSIHCIR